MKIFWNTLGFQDFSDYINIAIINKSMKLFMIQLALAASVIPIQNFVEDWVFKPHTAVWLITLMCLADSLLGAYIAIKKGEIFCINKFTRLAPILISHLSIMSMAYHMSVIDPFLFNWLPEAVFAFFSGRNLMSIIRHAVIMKWVRGDFVNYLIERIKPDIVDSIEKNQEKKLVKKTARIRRKQNEDE